MHGGQELYFINSGGVSFLGTRLISTGAGADGIISGGGCISRSRSTSQPLEGGGVIDRACAYNCGPFEGQRSNLAVDT